MSELEIDLEPFAVHFALTGSGDSPRMGSGDSPHVGISTPGIGDCPRIRERDSPRVSISTPGIGDCPRIRERDSPRVVHFNAGKQGQSPNGQWGQSLCGHFNAW